MPVLARVQPQLHALLLGLGQLVLAVRRWKQQQPGQAAPPVRHCWQQRRSCSATLLCTATRTWMASTGPITDMTIIITMSTASTMEQPRVLRVLRVQQREKLPPLTSAKLPSHS